VLAPRPIAAQLVECDTRAQAPTAEQPARKPATQMAGMPDLKYRSQTLIHQHQTQPASPRQTQRRIDQRKACLA
jgi:hypothetical protein